MTELPTYPTDAAIYRLLAGGPLPTAAIADRLAMPERTARHRLHQLRRSGVVVSDTNGLHRLAVPALAGAVPALAVPVVPSAAPVTGIPMMIAPNDTETDGGNRVPTTLPGGYWTALVVLAVAGIGLAAVVIWRRPSNPPPPPPVVNPGGWGPWPGW
ncbi:MAG TPA: winged helix-turn-helix domain-containing protein [Candidatus Saccharimonadales bacterium]|nr:winged helix-turn-helix domain-containing protein [Candidatus Saccharimonadales bacterium]